MYKKRSFGWGRGYLICGLIAGSSLLGAYSVYAQNSGPSNEEIERAKEMMVDEEFSFRNSAQKAKKLAEAIRRAGGYIPGDKKTQTVANVIGELGGKIVENIGDILEAEADLWEHARYNADIELQRRYIENLVGDTNNMNDGGQKLTGDREDNLQDQADGAFRADYSSEMDIPPVEAADRCEPEQWPDFTPKNSSSDYDGDMGPRDWNTGSPLKEGPKIDTLDPKYRGSAFS